jgi:hypothetical protein
MTTLQEFSDYVRERAAVENDPAIAPSTLLKICNGALSELYGLLVRTYEDYFLTTSLAALAGNEYIIALPPNLMKIRAVDYNQAYDAPNDLWYTINQMQLPERNQFNNPLTTITAPWGKVCLSWRLGQNQITIAPQSQCAGVYRIWYVPKYVNLVDPSDVIPSNMDQNGWIELGVASACMRINDKLKIDSSAFRQDKLELTQRIKSEAKNRQAAGGKRVANIRYNNSDMLMPGGWNSD